MAAQFIIVKGKEYKVTNWIDGFVYFTTFSAAGKESTVRSEKTKAVVMAALVEHAHDVALGMNEYADFQALPSHQQAIHHARVAYGLDLARMYCTDVITACHTLALIDDKTFNLQRRVGAQIAAGHPVDEEGNDTREWCGNDVEAAHAEALALNTVIEKTENTTRQDINRQYQERVEFWYHCQSVRDGLVRAAHTEALELDKALEGTATITLADVCETPRSLFAVANEYVRSVMIADAYIAALEENNRFDWLRARFDIFHASSARVKLEMVDEAHAEALRLIAYHPDLEVAE